MNFKKEPLREGTPFRGPGGSVGKHKEPRGSLGQLLKEFRPSLFFLGRFLAIYFIGNILYGVYVESFWASPDRITISVSNQTASILDFSGFDVKTRLNEGERDISLLENGKVVLNVFEGCNGINIMILFVAFLVAFSGWTRNMLWFIPVGILLIHIFNIGRIAGLYKIAQDFPDQFYYVHKYLFTSVIYAFVFLLWAVWIWRYGRVSTTQ